MPLLSVIIPTHRRPGALARVLEALASQNLPAEAFEVIVVQDGPCQETRELLERGGFPFRVRRFEQTAKGAPAARNLGVENAAAGLLVFLDDDIVLLPGALEAYLSEHRAQSEVVLFGSFLRSPDSPHPLVQDVADLSVRHYERCSAADYRPLATDLPDGNMSVRREHIIRAGGWDEHFTGVGGDDDAELGLRLLRLGLRLRYVPQALGYHYWSKSWGRLLSDKRNIGRSHAYFVSKHPEMARSLPFATFASGKRSRRLAVRLSAHIPRFAYRTFAFAVEKLFAGSTPSFCGRLWRLLIRISAGAFYLRGFGEADPGLARRLTRAAGKRIPVLAYHHISPDPAEQSDLTMTLAEFQRQMRFLAARGYQTITPWQLHAWYQRLEPLPKKPVMLTFDDGYAGFAAHVAPVLRRYNFSATVFLLAGKVGEFVHWDGYRPMRIMDRAEIVALLADGIDFQAHTATHPDLTGCAPAAVAEELTRGASIIEEITGRPVRFFAYPHGRWNAEVRHAVARLGYLAAFTCKIARNTLKEDPLLLNRVFLSSRPPWWRLYRELTR